MINPATSRGLPPNLVIDDPRKFIIFKGTDINMAALQSELRFLSMPVSHVQSAKMGNQALISARHTHKSNEILFQMMVAYLIATCQALDIRTLNEGFFPALKPRIVEVLQEDLTRVVEVQSPPNETVLESLMKTFRSAFDATISMDISNRFHRLAKSMFDNLLRHVVPTEWPAVAGIEAHILSVLSKRWSHNKENHILHGSPDPDIRRANVYRLHYPRFILD